MPTVLMLEGFRFFFYSNEGNEAAHVHVEKGDAVAKVWLQSLEVAYQLDFSPRELRRICEIIEENQTVFIAKWNAYFSA